MSARVLGLLLMLLVLCVCIARGQSNADGATGIKGVIMVSPIRPGPVTKGSEFPTAAPLPNATFRVTSDENVVTKFTTDTDGRFQITLKPGHYVFVLAENRFPKGCGPFEVTVETAKMTTVNWRCDSGMR